MSQLQTARLVLTVIRIVKRVQVKQPTAQPAFRTKILTLEQTFVSVNANKDSPSMWTLFAYLVHLIV